MKAQVRSLNLFNLDEIILSNTKRVLELQLVHHVTNKKDLLSLFSYYNLMDIINIYKNNDGFITFYLSTNVQNLLSADGAIVNGTNCIKFLELVTKRIHFPIIISSLRFEDISKLLSSKCPEYDEIIERYKFMSELLPEIVHETRRLKFYNLSDKMKTDIEEQIQLLKL